MGMPTPPDGYEIVPLEEYSKRKVYGTIYWNGLQKKWETAAIDGSSHYIAHAYARPIAKERASTSPSELPADIEEMIQHHLDIAACIRWFSDSRSAVPDIPNVKSDAVRNKMQAIRDKLLADLADADWTPF